MRLAAWVAAGFVAQSLQPAALQIGLVRWEEKGRGAGGFLGHRRIVKRGEEGKSAKKEFWARKKRRRISRDRSTGWIAAGGPERVDLAD